MKKTITLGTRGSALALTQANAVIERLKSIHEDLEIEIKVIKTTGDKILDKSLSKIGGKGLFVKEIEEALQHKEIDFAVHSMKDVPNTLPEGFMLGAILQREDPRDVLISKRYKSIEELPQGALVGTSSLRRSMQVKGLRPDVAFAPLRGNIDTRIKRAMKEEFDAIILAAAGLHRMGWKDQISSYLDVYKCIPAVGQGALGLEIREGDLEMLEIISVLHSEPDAKCVLAERMFLKAMNGGCHIPIGAYAAIEKKEMTIRGFIGRENEEKLYIDEVRGAVEQHEALGELLAEKLQKALHKDR